MDLSTFDPDHKRFHRQTRPSAPAGRPKHKRKRLHRIPTLWARLAVLALIVVALVTGMVGLTLKAIRPYRQASVEAASLADTRRQILALNCNNDVLRQRIAYLKTPQGIAAEAHPLGYVHPGEQILVMPGDPSADANEYSTAADIAPAAPIAAPHSLMVRFWSHLREL